MSIPVPSLRCLFSNPMTIHARVSLGLRVAPVSATEPPTKGTNSAEAVAKQNALATAESNYAQAGCNANATAAGCEELKAIVAEAQTIYDKAVTGGGDNTPTAGAGQGAGDTTPPKSDPASTTSLVQTKKESDSAAETAVIVAFVASVVVLVLVLAVFYCKDKISCSCPGHSDSHSMEVQTSYGAPQELQHITRKNSTQKILMSPNAGNIGTDEKESDEKSQQDSFILAGLEPLSGAMVSRQLQLWCMLYNFGFVCLPSLSWGQIVPLPCRDAFLFIYFVFVRVWWGVRMWFAASCRQWHRVEMP